MANPFLIDEQEVFPQPGDTGYAAVQNFMTGKTKMPQHLLRMLALMRANPEVERGGEEVRLGAASPLINPRARQALLAMSLLGKKTSTNSGPFQGALKGSYGLAGESFPYKKSY